MWGVVTDLRERQDLYIESIICICCMMFSLSLGLSICCVLFGFYKCIYKVSVLKILNIILNKIKNNLTDLSNLFLHYTDREKLNSIARGNLRNSNKGHVYFNRRCVKLWV